jgi:hypothetical protein
MIYECPRCKFTSESKSHYLAHLNRQNICSPTFSDKPPNEILEELIEEKKSHKKHPCKYCDKSFSHSSGLSRHYHEAHVDNIKSVEQEAIEKKTIEKEAIKQEEIEKEAIKQEAIEEEQEDIEIDSSRQLLIDFGINYKAKKLKYIEECITKWKIDTSVEAYKRYMKECMEKFYTETNRRKEYGKLHKLITKSCLTLNCTTQVTKPKYKGYCFYCFVHLFPDEPIIRNWKVKEQHVHDFILEKYPDRDFVYNKSIKGGCSRKIPDWFFECLTHSIVVENDENQHVSYSCENKRNMELFQDLGNRPIVFIRFNPDSYIDENDNKIESSFRYHGTIGVPFIRDKDEWNNRLNKLKETLDFHLVNIPEKEVTVVNLFYDQNL